VSTDDDEKLAPGRIVAAIFFALPALALLVFACLNLVMGAHHTVRGIGTLILALACVTGAWFALRYQSLAKEEAREAERAAAEQADSGQASPEQADSEHATASRATGT
jgi:hypothetical protein